MTSFKDIFKKSFIQGFTRYDMSPQHIVIIMTISAIFALFIFATYRIITKKSFYSKTFNIALSLITIITTSIILTIQSSIVVSLGMVGALSIVRFRTAIKEPMDLVFLFWSIATGIICGAGIAEIACILAFFMVIFLYLFEKIPVGKAPKILMINCNGYDSENSIIEIVKKYCKYYTVKSRSLMDNKIDLVIEVRTASESMLIGEIAKQENVISSSLLTHDGEVTY